MNYIILYILSVEIKDQIRDLYGFFFFFLIIYQILTCLLSVLCVNPPPPKIVDNTLFIEFSVLIIIFGKKELLYPYLYISLRICKESRSLFYAWKWLWH